MANYSFEELIDRRAEIQSLVRSTPSTREPVFTKDARTVAGLKKAVEDSLNSGKVYGLDDANLYKTCTIRSFKEGRVANNLVAKGRKQFILIILSDEEVNRLGVSKGAVMQRGGAAVSFRGDWVKVIEGKRFELCKAGKKKSDARKPKFPIHRMRVEKQDQYCLMDHFVYAVHQIIPEADLLPNYLVALEIGYSKPLEKRVKKVVTPRKRKAEEMLKEEEPEVPPVSPPCKRVKKEEESPCHDSRLDQGHCDEQAMRNDPYLLDEEISVIEKEIELRGYRPVLEMQENGFVPSLVRTSKKSAPLA